MIFVLMYLSAIVAANLTVAAWGPSMVIINAFLFIGLDLTARDRLHDYWRGHHLVAKMAALILAGSLLSWGINQSAGRIAVASAVAFAVAAALDALIYAAAIRRPAFVRVNGSNLAGAAADSLIFPALAFGVFLPWVILGQFVAKVAGGLVWWSILRRSGVR